ncbi:acetylornithine deacetylase [Salinarimonas soli]|uniref:Acetylornithine deacetylase n=1 Tax=Salinarimonas soli TaxID=1638099 RepID=A0A5B2W0T4_9HYPH|nr:acetylornithine deacetylase [Salinarimonas soli]KAA2244340.1 acetylornithine deacetylase [Salinarimonas soli]
MQPTSREMLERLVAFPSVSSVSNLDIIAFCRDWLAGHGVEARIVPSPEGDKANLFATIGPDVPGGIVLSGHTDVVPVEGQAWTSDPFRLTERDGRLYGRGTCDMKGFDAIVLALVPEMLAAPLRRPIHIALSYDEEIACRGAPHLVRAMGSRVAPPSSVIVGEPTRLAVVTGHKASVQMMTRLTGYAVHSSRMDLGVSAVMTAARLITWLDDRTAENRAAADPSSAFEPPYTTLHCGIMGGGNAVNTVAGQAWFSTDIRSLPTEDIWVWVERYRAHIRDAVEPAMRAVHPGAGVEIEIVSDVPGLRPEAEGAAEGLCRRLTGDNGTHVVSYGTEAGLFQNAGWSTVVCGPGDIAQAHQPDEFIEISQLAAGEAFLRRVIAELCA